MAALWLELLELLEPPIPAMPPPPPPLLPAAAPPAAALPDDFEDELPEFVLSCDEVWLVPAAVVLAPCWAVVDVRADCDDCAASAWLMAD
ncbi:protein of unknown function [Pararobbsia alpina]